MPVASLQASTVAPSLLEFPSDGSLLMPEVPDSDEEGVENDIEQDDIRSPRPRKRKQTAPTQHTPAKRSRRTRQSSSGSSGNNNSNLDSHTEIPHNPSGLPTSSSHSGHKRK